jgi:hypothetical protein
MFEGVSQCIPVVDILYFGPFNPFHYTPLPLYLPLLIFQQILKHILRSSAFTDVMFYDIVDALSFSSFPSFSEFHRIVPPLQTCSTYEFVYGHARFCEYAYPLDLSSTYERKYVTFVFFLSDLCLSDSGLLHVTWCPPIVSITFKPHISIPYGWVILHCVYVAQFHDPFISCRAPGLFLQLAYCE